MSEFIDPATSDGQLITVIDVCRELDVEPRPDMTWSVGNLMREWYESNVGELPRKELRNKTYGGGSHCFAVYPQAMRQKIASLILAHDIEQSRQGRLDL
jgi:hypothetical protein